MLDGGAPFYDTCVDHSLYKLLWWLCSMQPLSPEELVLLKLTDLLSVQV